MAYRIEFKKSAAKEYKALTAAMQTQVREALHLLAVAPFSKLLDIKKLKDAESLYRVRFGNYRMVYEVHSKVLLIVIIKIGHRREVYR